MNHEPTALSYRGGLLGAFAPLLLFLTGVIWLGLSGAPGEQGFWPILVLALGLGLLLCRDRTAFAEAIIGGMSEPIIMVMILAWLLAGVLASLMNAAGFVEALVWSAEQVGVAGVGFAVVAFFIAAAVSTSTGTSLGTLILCSPLLYPAGGSLGTDPALLMGAILGGATFGDNVSPVSDTTIASTVTQGARIGEVVRSRLRYAVPAAVLALIALVIFHGALDPGAEAVSTAEANPAVAEATAPPAASEGPTVEADEPTESSSSPRGLPMLLAPALVIFLLFRHVHLLEGLMSGIAAAMVIGVGLGLISIRDLIFVEPEAFTASGILVEGMQRGVGVSIFTILLMGLVAGLEASGVIHRLLGYAKSHIDSPRSAEWWAFGTVSAATLLTTHSVVALLAVGSFARETGFSQGIRADRRANILDTTVCTYPFLLPYCIPTILAASTTVGAGAHGMPQLNALTVGLYNFHSWALLAMVLFAISTGWGRVIEDPSTKRDAERSSPWQTNAKSDSSSSLSSTSMLLRGADLRALRRRDAQGGSVESAQSSTAPTTEKIEIEEFDWHRPESDSDPDENPDERPDTHKGD